MITELPIQPFRLLSAIAFLVACAWMNLANAGGLLDDINQANQLLEHLSTLPLDAADMTSALSELRSVRTQGKHLDLTKCRNSCRPGPRVCGPDPNPLHCHGVPPVCGTVCTQLPNVCGLDCSVKNPIDVGYGPEAHPSASTLALLEAKAVDYEVFADRHFVDGQFITAEVDLMSQHTADGFYKVRTHHHYQNASGATGLHVASLAYKYGVTHAEADLLRLRKALLGLHIMMTIANEPIQGDTLAPVGFVIDPRKDGCAVTRYPFERGSCPPNGTLLPPGIPTLVPGMVHRRPDLSAAACAMQRRRGVWVRSFGVGWYDEEALPEAVRDLWSESPWGFQGTLPGFSEIDSHPPHYSGPSLGPTHTAPGLTGSGPGWNPTHIAPVLTGTPRYRFVAWNSRDNVDIMMFGLAAANEVLSATGREPELRRNLGLAVGEFVDELITNGYQMRDIDGAFLERGDMRPGSKNDPSQALELLNWLRLCGQMTPNQTIGTRCRSHYNRVATDYLGQPASLRQLQLAIQPLLQAREFLQVAGFPNGWRPLLVLTTLHSLVRSETDPTLRAAYRRFLKVYFPLASYRKTPLYDAIFLTATGQSDAPTSDFENDGGSLRGRISGVLKQFPFPQEIFALPPGALPACAHINRRFPTCTDDSVCKEVDFSSCAELKNPFSDAVARAYARLGRDAPDNLQGSASIWELGPRYAGVRDQTATSLSYALKPEQRCEDASTGGIWEPAGDDYLVQYWFARYHHLLN